MGVHYNVDYIHTMFENIVAVKPHLQLLIAPGRIHILKKTSRLYYNQSIDLLIFVSVILTGANQHGRLIAINCPDFYKLFQYLF